MSETPEIPTTDCEGCMVRDRMFQRVAEEVDRLNAIIARVQATVTKPQTDDTNVVQIREAI